VCSNVPGYAVFVWLRRQRVQTFTRTEPPSTWMSWRCRFGLNVRFVFGASRSQRPECWCRMLRPKVVPLPQTAQIAGMCILAFESVDTVLDS